MKQGSFSPAGYVVHTIINTINPSDSLPTNYSLHHRLIERCFTALPFRGGSPQFRFLLSIHADSHTPGDSSMVFFRFFPSSMAFTKVTEVRLLLFPSERERDNDAAEFILYYGLYLCTSIIGLILPLSTPYFYDAPGLATWLPDNYQDWTFTS